MKKILITTTISLTLCGFGKIYAQTKAPLEKVDRIKKVNITGNDIQETVNANGGTVAIIGNNCEITVKGSAEKLTVSGNENKIYIDKLNHLELVGSDNIINYKTTDNKTKKPITAITGSDNSIKKIH